MRLRPLLLCALIAAPLCAARAEDLFQVYQDAKSYDATYAAAKQALAAGQEKLAQGRALLLPSLNLNASATETSLRQEFRDQSIPKVDRDFRTNTYTLVLTQPLLRMQNVYSYDQGGLQTEQAEAVFRQAEQDLILRATRAYFDVLLSDVTLQQVRANKAAISEQLAQAKRNFEVGTATITDTHEAQARYDLATAQEIGSQNDLENKQRSLQLVTGKVYGKLRFPHPNTQLSDPNPNNMESWVQLAEKQGYPVVIQNASTEIARLEAKRQFAGHYPTLDFVGTYGQTGQTGTALTGQGSDVTLGTIGLQLQLPIFAGGGVSSREREAAANFNKAREDLENARRSAALAARSAYLAVISGNAQVRALQQALVSSRSALDSNKLGYEVGVRINIDVLNAQQQVFLTQQNLAQAAYNAIIGQMQLKAAAGSLREEDVQEINRILVD